MIKHRKTVTLLVTTAIVAAGIAGNFAIRADGFPSLSRADAAPAAAAPVEEVDVAPVVTDQIRDYRNYSGRIEAIDKVEIRPQVQGTITAVHFKDGALVNKGDPLFTIDPRPYQAEVDKAVAQIAAAQADLDNANIDAARVQRLLNSDAVAKREYDKAQSAARTAAANVDEAKAALSAAKVNLDYTEILAPVSGRVSRAELTVGNTVNPGASAPLLTTLVSVSPIYASFDVDEQTYLEYLNLDRNKKIPVKLGLGNDTDFPREGKLSSVDNQLDTVSGTIRVRASFDNADGTLIPGLYARVKVGSQQHHDAVLISEKAVGTDQDKKYVLVARPDNHVEYREVVLGAKYKGLRVVLSGLQSDDKIVVNGLQRVRPGDEIKPNFVVANPPESAAK